jgi:hypothetical protein
MSSLSFSGLFDPSRSFSAFRNIPGTHSAPDSGFHGPCTAPVSGGPPGPARHSQCTGFQGHSRPLSLGSWGECREFQGSRLPKYLECR